ncbi:MAG: serine/threonine-protein kinase, partial [Planctomycetes bacterium]|nr:serine/threonine-protein kinase [Planctomycetota bacterium]
METEGKTPQRQSAPAADASDGRPTEATDELASDATIAVSPMWTVESDVPLAAEDHEKTSKGSFEALVESPQAAADTGDTVAIAAPLDVAAETAQVFAWPAEPSLEHTGPDATQRLTPEALGLGSMGATLPPGVEAAAGESPAGSARPDKSLGRFGDYDLLSEIARGGMGVVYKARQRKLNRLVALKMILAGRFAGEEDVRRFYLEAEAAAQLDHPHIVPIYEVGRHEGQHFFSMAFIDGQSLADRVGDQPLAPREAARLIIPIASAVEYAHRRGVIHRDLKPANILLDDDGQPKITDFGLAKIAGEESGLTMSGQIVGTPSYMPPEQASGDMTRVTAISDVYSLGALLYYLLCGRPPFRAATVVDTLKQVLEREPVSPRQLNHAVDTDLETICLKCLAKEPSRRYQSAAELVEDLNRFLAGVPVLARPVGRVERAWRWCRRNPLVAALLAAVALSLAAGTVVSTGFAIAAANRAKEAERNLGLAERNFQHARRAVDEFFTRVSEDTLLNQPGMQPLRQELLQQALDYYRLFLAEYQHDPSLRDELGRVYYRVGVITEMVESPVDALPLLEKAREVQEQLAVESPRDAERLLALSNTLTKLATLEFQRHQRDEARRLYERSRDLRRTVVEIAPDAAEHHRLHANAVMNLGVLSAATGDTAAAVRRYEEAQQIRRDQLARGDDRSLRRDLAKGSYNLGRLLLDSEDTAVPAKHLKQAVEGFRRLIEEEPDAIEDRSLLAQCCWQLGDLSAEIAEAADWYQQALDQLGPLTRKNPNVTDLRLWQAGVYMNLAGLRRDSQESAAALKAFRNALDILELLNADCPGVPRHERDLAVTLRDVALLEAPHQAEAARAKLERSRTLLGDLVERHGDTDDYREQLAATLAALQDQPPLDPHAASRSCLPLRGPYNSRPSPQRSAAKATNA